MEVEPAKIMDHHFSSTRGRLVSYLAVAAILVVCFSITVIQPPLRAALLQQKSKPEPKQQKSGGGAAAKKSEEASAPSEKESKSADAPRISLGEITGSPGASLMIPLYYTPAKSEPLRSLIVDIDYVSNHLKFQKASPGVIPEGVGADIAATVADGSPDAKGVVRSKVRVTVSLTDKNPPKGLPEGLLAFLLFQVSMDAKPFTIKMTPTVASAEDLHTPPRKVAKVNTEPGTVVVETPDLLPEATCFFFNH